MIFPAYHVQVRENNQWVSYYNDKKLLDITFKDEEGYKSYLENLNDLNIIYNGIVLIEDNGFGIR